MSDNDEILARGQARLLAAPAEPDDEPQLLSPDDVAALRVLLRDQPDAVCEYLGKLVDRTVTPADASGILDEMDHHLEEGVPEAAKPKKAPPADFVFSSMSPDVFIDVNDTRYETRADWFQYASHGGLNAALFHAGMLSLPPFRRHHDHGSDFSYPLNKAPGTDLHVALFADFANGYYHSTYIARQLAAKRYAYGVHLGDVYYAGTEREVHDHFETPLAPAIAAGMELFALPGNHEMYAKGVPWQAYMDRKHTRDRSGQRQEGTYFALERDGFLLLGLDTEWLGHARCQDPVLHSWLASRLRQARQQGRMTILLSPDEPYTYGKTDTTALFADLAPLLRSGLVDVWLWGNTHYCALFEHTSAFPFIGSCIGHSGYPFSRTQKGRPTAAPTRFVETGSRFDRDDVRSDRGLNGYCDALLRTDGTLVLTYIDWMGRDRHRAVIHRNSAGVAVLAPPG